MSSAWWLSPHWFDAIWATHSTSVLIGLPVVGLNKMSKISVRVELYLEAQTERDSLNKFHLANSLEKTKNCICLVESKISEKKGLKMGCGRLVSTSNLFTSFNLSIFCDMCWKHTSSHVYCQICNNLLFHCNAQFSYEAKLSWGTLSILHMRIQDGGRTIA